MRTLESISFALRQARLDQGLTQKDLAHKARVSRAWLIALESGEANRAEIGKVLDVVRALGLEIGLTPSPPLTADEELIMRRLFDAR